MKLACAVAALALPLAVVNGQTPSPVAIKDAHIFTVSGAELPKGTVVLRDGLIEDVGANVTIPADAWIIDGTGLTVCPGFIDGLSTWGIPGAAPVAGGGRPAGAPGATPAAAPAQTTPAPRSNGPEDRPQTHTYERAADLVSPSDHRLEAARAAGFTSAVTFPNQGIFEGLGAIINLAGERGRDMVIMQPIGQQVVIRPGRLSSGFPNSLMGNIAYIRQMYLDLDQYKRAREIYDAHPGGNRRPEYDHYLQALSESPRLLLPAVEEQQIDRMLAFGAELKTPFVLYGLHEGFTRVDQLKQANVPVLVSLKWPEKPKESDPADIPNYRELVLRQRAPSVPGMLSKAQVRFALYSDGIDTAPELRKAVKKAIDAGLGPADAVRALTLSVAEIYGVSDRMGSIDKGKIANLVVMRGDPFEDKTTVEYVFIDGQEMKPSKELQKEHPPGAAGAPHPSENLEGGQN